jgi:uncharacterized protein
MRTYKGTVSGAVAAFLIFVPVAVGEDHPPDYPSATEAYRQGVGALTSHLVEAALPALEYAAKHGVLGAQLKLARLYASGQDVAKNDAKAFFYFRQIANQQAEINPSSPVAKYVGEAFVALGRYYRDGIKTMPLAPDPAYAANLFRHAASYFGNADAQYLLAKLYLEGKGVEKNPVMAANWLAMSARKQHAASQAALGELLWRGKSVRIDQAKGLALLMLAQENAREEETWIGDLYRNAFGKADNSIRAKAEALLPGLGGEKRAASIIAKIKEAEPVPVARDTEPSQAPTAAATPTDSTPPGDTGASSGSTPMAIGFGASPSDN